MSKTLTCRVVTPTKELLSEPVTYASVPSWDGLFGVLPGHAPLVAELGVGELRLEFPKDAGGGGDRSYLVAGGFIKVTGSDIIILADEAIPAEELRESDAQAELAEAEARQVDADAPDLAGQTERIRRERNRARVAIRLAQRSKSKGI